MKRKFLLVLVFALVFAGVVFAEDSDFATMPKNTVTVDIGPTIIGLLWKSIGDMVDSGSVDVSSFGIAVQYERQIQEKMSVAGRFAYLSFGVGIVDSDSYHPTSLVTTLSSFSVEGHVRFYPSGDVFFIDGMLGYANLEAKSSGSAWITDENTGTGKDASVSTKVSRDYFKYGGKIGWRITAGSHGGFVFEPSFGWYGGIGIGDTIGKKLAKEAGGENDSVDNFGWYWLEQWIFVGGPRLSLSFGARF